MCVAVIGAGIVGLCSAERLSRDGFEVVIFDEGVIPAPRAASNDRRRLLRHASADDVGYVARVDQALSAWEQLWTVLGENFYRETGVLALQRGQDDFAAKCQRVFEKQQLDYQILEPSELVARFAFLRTENVRRGIYSTAGGVLKADRIMTALTQQLVARGVRFEPGLAAKSADLERGLITLENDQTFEADKVVVSAGAWTPALVGLNNGISAQRQVVVHAVAPAALTDIWQSAPAIVDFGGESGAYLVPPAGDATMTLGVETMGRLAAANVSRIPVSNEGVRLRSCFAGFLKDIEDYRIERTRICCYSVSKSGRWHLQAGTRGIALTACNGHMFKFGALLGMWLSEWVSGSKSVAQLRRSMNAD